MVVLPSKGDVLAGHVVEGRRGVPRLERVAGILCEILRAGGRGGAIDRRQQHQVAPGIIDRSAAQGYAEQVLVKPQAVVNHESEKALFLPSLAVPGAIRSTSALAAGVDRHRKRRF